MTETTENQLTARFKQLRTKRHLQAAPDLVAHMLHQVSAFSSSAPDGMPRGSGGSYPIPLKVMGGSEDVSTPLEDANSLYAQLVNWSISHARSLYVLPPSIALGWHRRDEDCDGFPSWATVTDAAALTNDITDWLVIGAPRIATLYVADAYYDDIRDMMTPLYGRYPMAPARPQFASRECLVCGKHTVVVNFDDDDQVSVACTYCGHAVPASAYESYLEESSA